MTAETARSDGQKNGQSESVRSLLLRNLRHDAQCCDKKRRGVGERKRFEGKQKKPSHGDGELLDTPFRPKLKTCTTPRAWPLRYAVAEWREREREQGEQGETRANTSRRVGLFLFVNPLFRQRFPSGKNMPIRGRKGGRKFERLTARNRTTRQQSPVARKFYICVFLR